MKEFTVAYMSYFDGKIKIIPNVIAVNQTHAYLKALNWQDEDYDDILCHWSPKEFEDYLFENDISISAIQTFGSNL